MNTTQVYRILITIVMVMTVNCRPQSTFTRTPGSTTSTFKPKIFDSENFNLPPKLNRTILIENFKSKVFKYLNWTAPPVNNISSPKLPKEVIAHLNEQHILSEAKLKEDVLVRPSNCNSSCLTSTNCSRFEFIAKQDIETISSVQLLLYKRHFLKNLSVTLYSSTDAAAEPVIHLKDHHSKSEVNSRLVTFELPKILALGSKNGEVSCTAEVEGSSVHEEGEYSPILILTRTIVKEEKSRRTARSHGNCNSCCLESFVVSIEELGWDAWIIKPNEFNLGNCVGHCTETLTNYQTQYQTIRNMLYKKNSTLYPKPNCAFWEPKCKPTQLLTQDIMYESNSTVFHDQIPDLLVDSCQCS